MRVGIALGSNLGDRAGQLRAAVAAIRKFAELPVLISRVYETEPQDCPPNSPKFLNAAMEIGYSGDLRELLRRLQSLEQAAGRPREHAFNEPRALDLDILYAGQLETSQADFVVPHPRLRTRAFVLFPLNDIVPDLILPNEKIPVSALLTKLDSGNIKLSQYSVRE